MMVSFCPYSTFSVLSVYLGFSIGNLFLSHGFRAIQNHPSQKRSHPFGFIFLINTCAISKGRQDDKISASFHNGFPDENLLWFSYSHELIFAEATGSKSTPQLNECFHHQFHLWAVEQPHQPVLWAFILKGCICQVCLFNSTVHTRII